ncbi:hypothetical protein Mchl_4084 [Methylorubrum extorquens CM4]|uniref:Uncharacterized protein n=1 Tax=Methylorubrum extorquens (strain CM4 / NCIMB 13688) TaxID=440085 RepID=B7KZV2_METC4|nr:hypothetical protein Mchl_4084 [Methylorubrum extorquens CM4]
MGEPGRKLGSPQALPPHDTITEGDAIGVLLSNRPARVWLDRADYERIIAAYGTRAWAWVEAARYVCIRPSRTENSPVARLVLENDGSGFVYFVDGDRLNLRRKNLSIQRHREQGRVVRRPAKGLFGRQKPAPEKSSSDVVGRPRPFPAAAPIVRPPANPVRVAVPTVKRHSLQR